MRVWALGFYLIAVLGLGPAVSHAQDRPLAELAALVPEDPQGWVSLADIAAAKAQARPYANPPSDVNLGLMAYTAIHPGPGFDAQSLAMSKDGFNDALGFQVTDIAGLATWGKAPDGPAIMTFAYRLRPSTVGPALTKRGYVVDSLDGVPVWHRQEDHEIVITRRREDPFSGGVGHSGRFALKDKSLIYTRTWPMLDRVLKGENSYGARPEVKAILDVAYRRDDVGELIEALFIGPQTIRQADAAASLGAKLNENPTDEFQAVLEKIDYPGLPPFLNHALLLWQDGIRLTGAIAVPYADEATARQGLNRFVSALKAAPNLRTGGRLAEFLPQERTFAVVQSGDRFVLLLMFHQRARERDLGSVMAFANNPVRRFTQMIATREWSLLTGYHE
ncbi:MAG: hypothetical protein AAF557_15290 [Pseudomonadota bacterium]